MNACIIYPFALIDIFHYILFVFVVVVVEVDRKEKKSPFQAVLIAFAWLAERNYRHSDEQMNPIKKGIFSIG